MACEWTTYKHFSSVSRDRSPENLPDYNSSGILSPTPSSSSTPTQSLTSGHSDSVSTYGESEIPTHWSLEVAECLAEKCLSDSTCREVVSSRQSSVCQTKKSLHNWIVNISLGNLL